MRDRTTTSPSRCWQSRRSPTRCCSRWSRPRCRTIQHDLHTTTTGAAWILTAYLLSASRRDADRRPARRHVRQEAHAGRSRSGVLALGTLLAALATTIGVMIVAPRDPGHRRRRLPARVRDHPRRVPARAGRRTGSRMISAIVGHRRRPRHRARRADRPAPRYHWLFWFPLVAGRRRRRRRRRLHPRVADPHAGAHRLARRGAALAGWLVALLVRGQRGPSWGWTSARDARPASRSRCVLAAVWVGRRVAHRRRRSST